MPSDQLVLRTRDRQGLEAVRVPTTIQEIGDASGLVHGALDSVASRLGSSMAQTVEALRNGDLAVCETVRHELAKTVAEHLGSLDHTVRGVYLCDAQHSTTIVVPNLDQPSFSPTIEILVWVSRKSEALRSVVSWLNSALADEAKRLAGRDVNSLCWMLDAHIVDDEQVQIHRGYRSPTHSVCEEIVEIWHR